MSKKMVKVGVGVALTAALVAGVTPANAAVRGPSPSAAVASNEVAARYTDADVVKFLMFGTGQIASDKPELVAHLGITPQPNVPQSTVDQVVAGLLSVDPAFHKNVTLNAQAKDPYKAEKAVTNFVADVKALSAKVNGTAAPDGATSKATANGWLWPYTYVAVSVQVAATAAIAVSVIAVAGALVVFAYEQPADSSELAKQNWATGLASL